MSSDPFFVHDCSACRHLGSVDLKSEVSVDKDHVVVKRYALAYEGRYDLYRCSSGSLVARYGSDGPEYFSGNCFAHPSRNYPLWLAAVAAKSKGLKVDDLPEDFVLVSNPVTQESLG